MQIVFHLLQDMVEPIHASKTHTGIKTGSLLFWEELFYKCICDYSESVGLLSACYVCTVHKSFDSTIDELPYVHIAYVGRHCMCMHL